MPAPIHTEIVFEDEVCEHLKSQGWLCDGPLPYQQGHAYDAGYDASLGLYPADALAWVKETQPEPWAKFVKRHAQDPEAAFLRRLAEELDRDQQLDERQGRLGLAIFVARESVDAAAEDRKRSPAGVLGRYTSCQIR